VSMAGPDWGDVPTWLGVLLVAAVAAFALLLYLREAERSGRAEAVRLDEERRAQASRVCGWYGRADGPAGPVFGALLRNASELPVYDVVVEFHFTSPRLDGSVWTLARGQSKRRLVPPGESFIPAPDAMLREVVEADPFVVSLSFRDAGNRRWLRDPDGVLSEATGA
jgi:hypothetical protein